MSKGERAALRGLLQRELPWLPAYDRRDVMTVKAVNGHGSHSVPIVQCIRALLRAYIVLAL
jgi:hypothetical protein